MRAARRPRLFPRRSRLACIAIFLTLVVEAAFRCLPAFAAGYLVDRWLGAKNRDELLLTVEILAAGAVAAIAAGLLRDVLFARLRGASLGAARQRMFEALQRLSLSFRSRTEAAELVDLFSRELASVESGVSMAVSWGLLPALESVFCTALIFWLDWRAGIVSLLIWFWLIFAPRLLARRTDAAGAGARDEELRVMSLVEESVVAQTVIKAFSLEQSGAASFRKRNDVLSRGVSRAAVLTAFMDRLTGTGVPCLQILVLAVCAVLVFDGEMSPGSLIAVQLLALTLTGALQFLTEYVPVLLSARLSWQKIHETLEDRISVSDAPGARILPPFHDALEFSGVTLRYQSESSETERPAVEEVSARLPRGGYYAFAGASGSGKSTMLNLLLRFCDPSQGAVFIDGHDLRTVTQSSLRANIGVVLQENFIFNASIRENIRLGRPDASNEIVMDAAAAAGITNLTASLPHGLDTLAGQNGESLTGEMTQRIALARALVRNPGILLLDELASALDPAEEILVNRTLRSVARGRTVISVTHRLSSAADADRIFYFADGRIVEQGSHFELMANNGAYADLWRKQAGFRFSADGRHVDVDAQRLKELPVLEKLDENILAELAPFFATETFPAGREIVRQNDPGDHFYIIVRGKVEVWRTEEQSGDTMNVAILQEGDFFGEITLITGFPRTATVRTVTVCTCISLERGQFTRLLDRFPDLRREVSEVAVQRLRESSKAAHAAR